MTNLLTNINRYYGIEPGSYPPSTEQDRKVLYNAYTLALCADPGQLNPPGMWPNYAPIIKPTYKHVVKPSEQVYKQIIAMDPDNDPLTVTVSGLPGGALYDSPTRTITWTPGTGDAGVYMVTITADDGTTTTSRPFPIIVKPDAGSGPIPSGPTSVEAILLPDNEVVLFWNAPGGVDVAYYVIYRDGSLHDVADGSQTSYIDSDVPTGSHTRYHLALYATSGAESSAAAADPAIISIPGPPPEPKQLPVGDFNGDGVVDFNDLKIMTDDWLVSDFVLTGLVSRYKFDGDAGDSVNGNHGTELGGPTYTAGLYNQAIDLDGIDDYVDCGNDSSFDITGPITLSVLLKGTFNNNWDGIITKGYDWQLTKGMGDEAVFYCIGLGSFLIGSANINDNQWHHIAAVYDGTKMCLYVDGKLDASQTASGSLNVSATNVYIGGGPSQSFNGLIDDVRIYDRAISKDELEMLYTGGPAIDLVSDHKIDFKDFAALAENWLR
jgi:hypothetical protein